MKFYFEKKFKGTPIQFKTMAEAFSWQIAEDEFGFSYHHLSGDDTESLTSITFWKTRGGGQGHITAQILPGENESLLFVIADDDVWVNIQDGWNVLLSEMVRQGWIDGGIDKEEPEGMKRESGKWPEKGGKPWRNWATVWKHIRSDVKTGKKAEIEIYREYISKHPKGTSLYYSETTFRKIIKAGNAAYLEMA